MKTKRVAKHALFTSVLALVLCVSMLVGTTFAWFTDSVTSGNNIIAAGNLDVELYNSIDTTGAKVTDQTALFDEITLWEPGVVAYENLTVANVGTLALKYELSVNFANAVATPEGKTLADVLKVAVIDGGVAEGLKRDEVVAKVSAADWKELKSFVQPGRLVADAAEDETSDTYAVVIYWQPGENDNDYNMNNGQTTELKIDLGVKLMATQLTHENDSFDNKYDEDSFYADANVATDKDLQNAIQDPSVETIAVHGSLVYDWGGDSYANSKSPHGKTFVGTDPATDSLTFKGYGSANAITNVTMRNITVHDETVGDDESSWEHGYLEFNGLTADNVVFADSIMLDGTCQLTNCTVDNQIPSWYGVWIKGGSTTLRDCTFTGTRAVKIHEAYSTDVASVVVDDCVFTLSEKPGVVIGNLNADTSVSITNSAFDTTAGDQGKYIYESDTDVATFNFTESGNTLTKAAEDSMDLKDAIAGEASVVTLKAGTYSLPSLAKEDGLTIIGTEGTVIGGESANDGFRGNFGKNTTIKNVEFSGASNGVRYSQANGGTSTFEDCTFKGGSTYGFHIDTSNGATLIFNDCTFVGFNAFASDLESVTFNNCTFLSNGNYGHTNVWSVGNFNNCTWGDKTSVSQGYNQNEQKYYGTLIFNGVEESYHHEFVGSVESLRAFEKSVNVGGDSWDGQKVLLVDDIDLAGYTWNPIGQTGSTTFSGSFDGQGHTISNLVVDSTAQTGGHYSSGLFGWIEISGSEYTVIENLKINGATITGNHNCAAIVGYATGSAAIKNCEVTGAQIVCNVANADANGDKAGVIVGNLTKEPETKVVNCTAADSTVTAGRDAGQLVGAGNVENVTGTATNVTVTANDQGTGDYINNALVGRDL